MLKFRVDRCIRPQDLRSSVFVFGSSFWAHPMFVEEYAASSK